jgi:hypothetical protein
MVHGVIEPPSRHNDLAMRRFGDHARWCSVHEGESLSAAAIEKVTARKHISANQGMVAEAGKRHFQYEQILHDKIHAGAPGWMNQHHASMVVRAQPQATDCRNVGERELGQGQPELLDQ